MIIKNITRFYVHHHLLPPNSLQRPKNGEPPELENYYHPNPSRAKKKGLTEICKCSSTFHGRSLITPPLFSTIAAVLAIIIAYRDQRDVRLPEQSNDFFFFFEPLSLRRRSLRQSLADLTCPSEQTHSPHLISHSCTVTVESRWVEKTPNWCHHEIALANVLSSNYIKSVTKGSPLSSHVVMTMKATGLQTCRRIIAGGEFFKHFIEQKWFKILDQRNLNILNRQTHFDLYVNKRTLMSSRWRK